jgi:hypothetical protein
MGNACPFCGNTLGAAIGSRIQSNAPTSDKLDRLNELHDSGHLTDEEYSSRRDRILDDAVATGPPQVSETQNVPSSPVRQSSRRPRKAWLIVAAVAVVIFGLISWAYSTIPKPPEPGPFTIELLNYRAENPASLVVRYDVTNHGPVAGNYRCRISASDPSNTYHGFGTFRSNTPLQAGATERATSALVITKEGAEYVTRVETSGCE